jgi:hypothetical protein
MEAGKWRKKVWGGSKDKKMAEVVWTVAMGKW